MLTGGCALPWWSFGVLALLLVCVEECSHVLYPALVESAAHGLYPALVDICFNRVNFLNFFLVPVTFSFLVREPFNGSSDSFLRAGCVRNCTRAIVTRFLSLATERACLEKQSVSFSARSLHDASLLLGNGRRARNCMRSRSNAFSLPGNRRRVPREAISFVLGTKPSRLFSLETGGA
ncbi:hypothetical protein NDU88_001797 [Pleurodeles waltl]|uniref:Secreted protein n=1 Tax=Pleurodeles waltl TaxID=8319 RepID=A0AAV7WNE6_PLEWA|nr:hypothetical protein NDU88_001797 [Pleurodeles waltl]